MNMSNPAESRWRSWRPLVSVAAATALAIPLLSVAPASATPEAPVQQQYLLSVSGSDLSEVAAQVEAAGGTVLETYEIGSALLVTMPSTAKVPTDAIVVPDLPMEFQGTDDPRLTSR